MWVQAADETYVVECANAYAKSSTVPSPPCRFTEIQVELAAVSAPAVSISPSLLGREASTISLPSKPSKLRVFSATVGVHGSEDVRGAGGEAERSRKEVRAQGAEARRNKTGWRRSIARVWGVRITMGRADLAALQR